MLSHDNTVVIDTETTGLDSNARIVEVTALNAAGEVLMDTLVWPGCPIPAQATAVHGITDANVEYAPTIDAIAEDLHRILTGSYVVSYNIHFDLRILDQSFRARGMPALPYDAMSGYGCIMDLYSEFHGEWNSFYGNYRWQPLDVAMSQCGLKFEGPKHRARGDAMAALAVLKHMSRA